MSKNHEIDYPIPYGEKLVIKQRDLDEMEKDVEEKIERFEETGESNHATLGFENPEMIREILTPKRRELMKAMIEAEPESVQQLAEITDRGLSEVHSDLKKLEENRIVFFEKNGRKKKPVIPYSEIEIRYNLTQDLQNMEVKPDLEKA